MFGALGDLANMFKQARQLQERMKEVQDELAKAIYEAEAGGGAVTARVNGRCEMLAIRIQPDAAGDVEALEEFVLSAVSAALRKAQEATAARMSELTAGMNLGGLTNLLKPGSPD